MRENINILHDRLSDWNSRRRQARALRVMKANIIGIAKRKGWTEHLPKAWQHNTIWDRLPYLGACKRQARALRAWLAWQLRLGVR